MSAASIALSGLRVSMLSMDASAHNIANAQTPGLRRQQVVRETAADGGVTATLSAAAVAQDGDGLIEDVVQQIEAGQDFQANVFSLRTQQDVLGQLLDLHA